MVINTNTSAQTTATLLGQSSAMLSKSLARLSSGSKITSPADDSAQISRNTAASNNIANANSFNQTQDGYLGQVTSALDRMSELSIQSQDVTKSDSDRTLYNKEFTTLASYVNDVSKKEFNGVSLFGGTDLSVTIDSDGSKFAMSGVDLTGTTFTTATLGTVDTAANAATALTAVKNAISAIATDRATLGSNEETLNNYSSQLATLNNNLSAANSVITDVDVATESTQYAKENILVQTGTAMLAQANALPQIALKLLQ
jgi:flagellin